MTELCAVCQAPIHRADCPRRGTLILETTSVDRGRRYAVQHGVAVRVHVGPGYAAHFEPGRCPEADEMLRRAGLQPGKF